MPERGQRTALLVIDMLNSYEQDDADRLARSVRDAVPHIAALIERARRDDVPIVYVNDNYGDWARPRRSLPGTPCRAVFPSSWSRCCRATTTRS